MATANVHGDDVIHLICIRHGESTSNAVLHKAMATKEGTDEDFDEEYHESLKGVNAVTLTEIGEQQAAETSNEIMARLAVNEDLWSNKYTFCHSDQKRAEKTSNLIVRGFMDCLKPPQINWTEGFDYTAGTTKEKAGEKGYFDAVKRGLREFLASDVEFGEETNESHIVDLITRVQKFMRDIKVMAKKPEMPRLVVLVGHSLFISTLLTIAANQGDVPHMYGAEQLPFQLPNCSISHVTYQASSKRWSLLSVGEVGHLSHPTGGHVRRVNTGGILQSFMPDVYFTCGIKRIIEHDREGISEPERIAGAKTALKAILGHKISDAAWCSPLTKIV